jgi:hypothetical protein
MVTTSRNATWSQALGTPVFLGQTTVSTAWYFAFITELAGVAWCTPQKRSNWQYYYAPVRFSFSFLCRTRSEGSSVFHWSARMRSSARRLRSSWCERRVLLLEFHHRDGTYACYYVRVKHTHLNWKVCSPVHVYTSGLRCTAAPGHIVRHCFFPSFSFTGRVLQNYSTSFNWSVEVEEWCKCLCVRNTIICNKEKQYRVSGPVWAIGPVWILHQG